MSEVGPATPEITAIIKSGDETWALSFEGDLMLTIEWADYAERIFISASAGKPPAARKAEVCSTLLAYNLLRSQTGGVTAAAFGPDSETTLICDLHVPTLQLSELRTVLVNFADLTQRWADYVTGDGGQAAPKDGIALMLNLA